MKKLILLKFRNRKKKNFFILYSLYSIITVIAFKVFGLHVSTLGDYKLYSRGTIEYGLTPEVITINIFTILSYIGLYPTIIGLFLLLYLSFYFASNVKQNIVSVFIFFSVLNPFTIQFLIYPSKEALLTILSLILIHKKSWDVISILLLIILFFIRPLYFIVFIVSRLIVYEKFFLMNIRKYTVLAMMVGVYSVYVLEQNNYTESVVTLIRQSFLPYAQASTNRDWIPTVVSIFSYDFIVWYTIGLMTVFFGFLKVDFLSLALLPMGAIKVVLIKKIINKRLLFFLMLMIAVSVYAVPLAVYNVGSALRYSIPLFVTLLSLYVLRMRTCDERRP